MFLSDFPFHLMLGWKILVLNNRNQPSSAMSTKLFILLYFHDPEHPDIDISFPVVNARLYTLFDRVKVKHLKQIVRVIEFIKCM